MLVGRSELVFGFVAQMFNSVTTVEGLSDLFVCLHESLEFCVKLSVLAGEDIAVMFQSFNFAFDIVVAASK